MELISIWVRTKNCEVLPSGKGWLHEIAWVMDIIDVCNSAEADIQAAKAAESGG